MATHTILDSSLDLLDEAPDMIDAANTLTACVLELSERVAAGIITVEARKELGDDMLALSEVLLGFAMKTLA